MHGGTGSSTGGQARRAYRPRARGSAPRGRCAPSPQACRPSASLSSRPSSPKPTGIGASAVTRDAERLSSRSLTAMPPLIRQQTRRPFVTSLKQNHLRSGRIDMRTGDSQGAGLRSETLPHSLRLGFASRHQGLPGRSLPRLPPLPRRRPHLSRRRHRRFLAHQARHLLAASP